MTGLIISVVTNNHESLLGNAISTLRTWRQRARARRELAGWSERELHDIGMSRSSIAGEVDKPFWRA